MSETVKLIELENEMVAKGLLEYLRTHNLQVELNITSQALAYQIMLTNKHQFQQAMILVKHFADNPNHTRYQHFVPKSQLLFGISALKQTPLTWLVLLLCALVYVFSEAGGYGFVSQHLKATAFQQIQTNHQWWRLVSPSFIHFSSFHILFNLVVWWQLARVIEFHFSSSKLLFIFVVTSVVSNLSQLLSTGVGPNGLSNFGGLSGVVYGVIGFVWWCGLLKSKSGLKLPNQFVIIAIGWLLLGYLDLLWVNMANEAHLFGLISGSLLAIGLRFTEQKSF